MSGKVEMLHSYKGGEMFAVGGFLYEKDRVRLSDGQVCIYAKCNKKRREKCNARIIITKDDEKQYKIKKSNENAHNHPAMPQEINEMKLKNSLMESVRQNPERPVKQIYQEKLEEYATTDSDTKGCSSTGTVTFDSISSALYRQRAKVKPANSKRERKRYKTSKASNVAKVVEVLSSSKDCDMYAVDDFLYQREKTKSLPKGQTCIYARCQMRRHGCEARITIVKQGDNQYNVKSSLEKEAHNHSPMRKTINELKFNNSLNSKVQDDPTPIVKNIYDETSTECIDDNAKEEIKVPDAPDFDSVSTTLCIEQAKQKPPDPTAPNVAQVVEVLPSTRDGNMYVVDDFLYEKEKSKSFDGQTCIYARCQRMRRHGCQARITIVKQGDNQYSVKSYVEKEAHNHSPMRKTINELKFKNSLKSKVRDDPTRTAKRIYDETLTEYTDDSFREEIEEPVAPNFDSVSTILYRERAKIQPPKRNPKREWKRYKTSPASNIGKVVEVLVSNKAGDMYAVDDFLYEREKTKLLPNGETCIYARCQRMRRQGCEARITILKQGDTQYNLKSSVEKEAHNHSPMGKTINEMKFKNSLKSKVREDPTRTIKRVYDETVSEYIDDSNSFKEEIKIPDVPNFVKVSTALYRERAKSRANQPGTTVDSE